MRELYVITLAMKIGKISMSDTWNLRRMSALAAEIVRCITTPLFHRRRPKGTYVPGYQPDGCLKSIVHCFLLDTFF